MYFKIFLKITSMSNIISWWWIEGTEMKLQILKLQNYSSSSI
jgi:hypothetical protein